MGQGFVWEDKEAGRPVQWEGRGEALSPSLSTTNPRAGVQGRHRGGRCGEKSGKGFRRESWSVC